MSYESALPDHAPGHAEQPARRPGLASLYLRGDACRRIGDDFLSKFMNGNGWVLGMNIIHTDGRGEWKPGKEIEQRYTTGSIRFYC